MTKLLLGVGALLMASVAVPASAHNVYGDSGYGSGYNNNSGYGYNGGSGYDRGYGYGSGYLDVVRQHVRACRQHERFHARLGQERDQFDDQGYGDNRGYARHDAYHDRRSGAQNCGYWYSQYNNLRGNRYRDGYDRDYRW